MRTKWRTKRRRQAAERPEIYLKSPTFVDCLMCGRPFLQTRSDRVYCSTSCCDRVRLMRKKAKRRGLFVEDVYLAELRRRDGDECHICKRGIDFDLRVPHPDAASVDHLIPSSRGGLHEHDNAALAHLVCNERKGAKDLELVGS